MDGRQEGIILHIQQDTKFDLTLHEIFSQVESIIMTLEEISLQGRYFLCIGAQKSGTTWLHNVLRRHPNVVLPYVKELSFWKLKNDKPLFSLTLSLDKKEAAAAIRRSKKALKEIIKCNRPLWHIKYLFGRRTYAWYQDLLINRLLEKNTIVGEVCPQYALLNTETLNHIFSKLPNIKVIYIIRDPIERAWSTAAMQLYDSKLVDGEPTVGQLAEIVKNEDILSHSRYERVLMNWLSRLSIENLLILQYEDIFRCPQETISKVCNFLKILDEKLKKEVLISRWNHHKYPPINQSMRHDLEQALWETYDFLDNLRKDEEGTLINLSNSTKKG